MWRVKEVLDLVLEKSKALVFVVVGVGPGE